MNQYSPLQPLQSSHHQESPALKKPNIDHPQNQTNNNPSGPLVCTSPLDKLKSIKEKASQSDKNEQKKSNQSQPSVLRVAARREEHSRGRLSRSRDRKKHSRQSKQQKKDSQSNKLQLQHTRQSNKQENQVKYLQKQKQYQLLVSQLLEDSKDSKQTQENTALKVTQESKSFCQPMIIPKNQGWDDVPTETELHHLDILDQGSPHQSPSIDASLNTRLPTKPLDNGQQMNRLQPKVQGVADYSGVQDFCHQNQPSFSSYRPLVDDYAHYPPYYFEQLPSSNEKQRNLPDKLERCPRQHQQASFTSPVGQHPRNSKTKFLLTQREKYYKTRLCFDFKMGKCGKSKEECNFAHGEDDIRPPKSNNPCRNFQRGYCKKTQAECKFVHALVNTQDEGKKDSVHESGQVQSRRDVQSAKDGFQKNESDKMSSAYLPSHSRVAPQQYFTPQDNPNYYAGNNVQFHSYVPNHQYQPHYSCKNYPFLPSYYHSGYNQSYAQQTMPYYHYQMHYLPHGNFHHSNQYQEDNRANAHLDSTPKNSSYPFLVPTLNSNFSLKPGYCDQRAKKNPQYSFEASDVGQERRYDYRKQ